MAKDAIEKEKLDSRYQAALADSARRGCGAIASKFEQACAQTAAVFNCSLQKLQRQVASGTQLFETYYDLERLRLQTSVPRGFDWAKLRPHAEIELLGSLQHSDKIHYACLSIDGDGLSSYGDCAVQLADSMIAHRASCFEGNSAVIFKNHPDFSNFLRCEWSDRHKMCVAVLAGKIDESTGESDFPGILIENGLTSADDRYIEVHIFGPITATTLQSVRIDATNHKRGDAQIRNAIKQKLPGVHFEVVTS